MSLNQGLTNLADAVRDGSNISQKLSISEMTYNVQQMCSLNNYFISKLPPLNDGKNHLSTPHGSAQRFENQGGFTGELVHPNGTSIQMNVLKGDTITQSIVIRSNGIFKNATFNFESVNDKVDHPIGGYAIKLNENTYKVIASYTTQKDDVINLAKFWADCKGGSYIEVLQPYAALSPELGGGN